MWSKYKKSATALRDAVINGHAKIAFAEGADPAYSPERMALTWAAFRHAQALPPTVSLRVSLSGSHALRPNARMRNSTAITNCG